MVDRICYKRHQFPPDVIRHTIWLYRRFTLSLRDVEEMLAERGIDVSRKPIRYWVIKVGLRIAANLRRRRVSPASRWHLDEMVVKIVGRRMGLWQAVDDKRGGDQGRMPSRGKRASLRGNAVNLPVPSSGKSSKTAPTEPGN